MMANSFRAPRRLALVALTLAASLLAPLGAALIPLSLGQLVQRSRLVLTGEVVALRSYRGPFLDLGEVIFTDVTIRVASTLKGTAPESGEVTVQVLGGELGDRFQRCLESPAYKQGEKVLVFLRDYNQAVWNTGWLQGKYTLLDDGLSARGEAGLPLANDTSLAAVRAEIARQSVSGGPAPPGGGK